MKKGLLSISLIFFINCGGGSESSPTEAENGNEDNAFVHNDIDGYEVVFFDYFDGPLDTSKWNDMPWWGREHSGNGSVMYYAPITDEEGPRVEGCCLKIPVDRLPDQSVLPVPYNDPSTWPGILDYTSGSINTHMKFNFTYGIVKFRAKAAKEKGIWPAVWMVPPQPYTKTHNTWGPEFDILEMSHLHRDNPNVMGGYIYWTDKDTPSPSFHFDESLHYLFQNYTNEWHDYEMHWSEESIKFYFDGHLLTEITEKDFPDSEPPHSAWIADVPMYLMINVAVGASWMENEAMPDENTQFPVDALMVDYIKVYQKIE
jgi:hypothetical protein